MHTERKGKTNLLFALACSELDLAGTQYRLLRCHRRLRPHGRQQLAVFIGRHGVIVVARRLRTEKNDPSRQCSYRSNKSHEKKQNRVGVVCRERTGRTRGALCRWSICGLLGCWCVVQPPLVACLGEQAFLFVSEPRARLCADSLQNKQTNKQHPNASVSPCWWQWWRLS